MPTTTLTTATITAAREWDEIRSAFAASIMVDTSLSSLAQNLDGPTWPSAGRDETAAEFIDFEYDELVAEFARRKRRSDAELLIQILRETLAFDQPFGEMVAQSDAVAERDNPVLRSLAKLGIREDFPLELTTIDDAARELCQLEQVTTLGEFALLAQRLSQGVIVGGGIRQLLNALAHVDEKVIASVVPYRPGSSGLYLAESLAQSARCGNAAERVSTAIKWFETEFSEWLLAASTGTKPLSRQLTVLKDPALEQKILTLLAPHLPVAKTEERPGIWALLLRMFKA